MSVMSTPSAESMMILTKRNLLPEKEPPAPDPTASFLPALVNRGLALRSAPPVAVDDDAYHADSDDFYDCEIMSVRCAA